uniref:SWIM-type domain-containing protein n=1 Tax=Angiostrongylus cantonensis TaxID=6313 RepID=A0A0K0DA66_ANGCA
MDEDSDDVIEAAEAFETACSLNGAPEISPDLELTSSSCGQPSTPSFHPADVERVIQRYGQFIEKFQFNQAREAIEQYMQSTSRPIVITNEKDVSCYSPHRFRIFQIANCDKNYYLLSFLQPKAFFRKENALKNQYYQIRGNCCTPSASLCSNSHFKLQDVRKSLAVKRNPGTIRLLGARFSLLELCEQICLLLLLVRNVAKIFESTEKLPRNRLINWFVQFYNLLMAKFSLYFTNVLANFCSVDDLKNIYTIDNGYNFISNATQLVKKTDAVCLAIVMDRENFTENFYGFGYHRLKDRFTPGALTEPRKGIAALCPAVFRLPSPADGHKSVIINRNQRSTK